MAEWDGRSTAVCRNSWPSCGPVSTVPDPTTGWNGRHRLKGWDWLTITRPKPMLESVDVLGACDYALGRLEDLILRAFGCPLGRA